MGAKLGKILQSLKFAFSNSLICAGVSNQAGTNLPCKSALNYTYQNVRQL